MVWGPANGRPASRSGPDARPTVRGGALIMLSTLPPAPKEVGSHLPDGESTACLLSTDIAFPGRPLFASLEVLPFTNGGLVGRPVSRQLTYLGLLWVGSDPSSRSEADGRLGHAMFLVGRRVPAPEHRTGTGYVSTTSVPAAGGTAPPAPERPQCASDREFEGRPRLTAPAAQRMFAALVRHQPANAHDIPGFPTSARTRTLCVIHASSLIYSAPIKYRCRPLRTLGGGSVPVRR